MHVINLGTRTVPVFSVAKKLAAPRRAPTAPAAKCGLIRQDETDWLWLSIGCWKTFALLLTFSSLLEVIKGRGELTECSKLTCFAKRMLHMVPGGSGEWDRRSVSATVRGIVGVFVRSKASWGREKIGPIRRIQTPKKKKKPSSTHEYKFTNESESRTEAEVRSTNCCVHACMQTRSCSACFV